MRNENTVPRGGSKQPLLKRLFSSILVACLLLTLLPTAAFATTSPTIGTLDLGSATFTAGVSIGSDAFAAYVPTVTDNGYTITGQGWEVKQGSDGWSNFTAPGGGATVISPRTTLTYQLRYYVTFLVNSTPMIWYSNEVAMNVVGWETALTLTASPESPQAANTEMTLTATLTGYHTDAGVNGQTITFKSGEDTLGTGTLSAGGVATCAWTPTAEATYNLSAEYAATAYNQAATGALEYTVSAGTPALPTAAEYAADAASVTDYVLDTGEKTLAIKTAKGAAFWSDSASKQLYLDYAVTLDANLDVSGFLWTPVGDSHGNGFTGSFDGQGHSISALTVNLTTDDYGGLFGKLYTNGTVKNVRIASGSITVECPTSAYAGGIAGYSYYSTILNCENHAAITAQTTGSPDTNTTHAGGLVGYAGMSSTVENALNTGAIYAITNSTTAYIDAGGVSGYSYMNAKISNCYNTGAVSATGGASAYAGGLAGALFGAKVSNSYYRSDSCAVGVQVSYMTSTITGCGTFADNTGDLTAGTAAQFLYQAQTLGHGEDLLTALNGYVTANSGKGYATWTADSAGSPANGGYPVLTASPEPAPGPGLKVTGDANGYTYEDGVLTFTAAGEYTVSMADGVAETHDRIAVDRSAGQNTVTLNLKGVHITAPAGENALTLAYTNSINILADSSLTGGDSADNTSNGGYAVGGVGGSVILRGNGTLTATGGAATGSGKGGVAMGGNFAIDPNSAVSLNATGGASASGTPGKAADTATILASRVMLGDSQSEMKLLTKMSPESADYQRRYLTAQPMPTVSEYLAAHSATAGTDYALDTGKKTLTIKTVSGAAWWSVNSASYLDYAVKLDTDLDLFDFLWSPVGADANAPFIGTFDGQNHRLFNLSIRAKGEYTGLFGCVKNAKIQNLCIASGKIFDVYRDVETYVGSVAGCAEGSTIVNCGNRAAISAFCLQTSTQNAFTGGLVGKMRGNTGVIANSYNTGVLGQSFGGWMQMGGIVGDDGGSKVLNCYSAGRQYNAVYLQSSTKHMGGITGRTASKNAENIQGCYYYRNQSNWTYDAMAGLELKPIAEMQAAVSSLNAYVAQNPGNGYATWLADSVNTPVNSGFPVLPTAGSSSGDPSAPPTLSAAEYLLQHPAVDGTDYALNTSAHTLVIKTAEGAAWWSANGNSADYKGFQSYTIVLENDLDLSGFLWTPVGSESRPVTAATFDGMGHRISNLTVDMQSSSAAYAGLFGKVVGATIRNLGLVNVNIAVTSTATSTATDPKQYGLAGGVAGYALSSTIYNCFVTGSVAATSAKTCAVAGGLVGFADSSGGKLAVDNCYSAASVSANGANSASSYGGGIAGRIFTSNAANVATDSFSLTGSVTAGGGGNLSRDGRVSTAEEMKSPGELGTGMMANLNKWATENGADYAGWKLDGAVNSGYPILISMNDAPSGLPTAEEYLESHPVADGTDYVLTCDALPSLGGTLAIKTASGAAWWSVNGSKYENSLLTVTLENNLDLSGFLWTPVGVHDAPFGGGLDGKGHSITGLTVDVKPTVGTAYAGLLGEASGGGVWNLGLINVNIRASSTASSTTGSSCVARAGGVVGYGYLGFSTRNCFVTGSVSATATKAKAAAGGIAGMAEPADNQFINCYTACDITSTGSTGGYLGGIAGYYPTELSQDAFTGNIFTLDTTATDSKGLNHLNGKSLTEGEMKVLSNDGTAMLELLNEWVTQQGSPYIGWKLDATVNKGFPILNLTSSGGSGATTVYTVFFNANGGTVSPAPATTNASGILTDPLPTPTRDGYAFAGWFTAASGGTEVGLTTVFSANATVYAHWKQTFAVGGTVNGGDNQPVAGAQVKLVRGRTEVQSTTTDAQGAYSFADVPVGAYNVVASKDGKTVTLLINVVSANLTEQNLTMPSQRKNSVLEVGANTPDAVVGGLDKIAEGSALEPGSTSITIKLTVQRKEEGDAANAGALKTLAGSKTVSDFLDLSLSKIVEGVSAGVTDIGSANATVLEIVIPYDFTGKTDVAVYRYHGEAQALRALSSRPSAEAGADQTFFADSANSLLYVYASKFSTYAVAYATGSGSGNNGSSGSGGSSSGGSGTYAPTVNNGGHGTVTVTPQTPTAGAQVDITVKPDSGYTVDKVTVTDANGKPVPVTDKGNNTYTYTQPSSGKVTVTVTYQQMSALPFTDVNAGDWFYEGVKHVYEAGLMNGTSDSTFSPYRSTSRGMIITILWRLEGQPTTAKAANFADVPAGKYYTEAVAWGVENSIVNGYGNGNYGPDDLITRQQLVAILYRYAQYKGMDVTTKGNLTAFSDQPSAWALEAVQWGVGAGIISGRSDGTLNSRGNATRAEVAVILTRFDGLS